MATQAVSDAEIDSFEVGLRGQVIRKGDPTYDEARAVWNGMIDKYPALIARCQGTADVITSVDFAREHDLPLSIRGGGHNVAGTAMCDDGLVIDLSAMNAVRVDPDERTAWVQGGAIWADVDHETQAFGLATPGGVVSDTGVGGLTLGGGIGHLRCKYGLSCDNLRSVDIVTADGSLLTASKEDHADLFWGLRGGGGNFGVVTGFEFELHPVGPEVATTIVFYPAEQIPEVMQGYRAYVDSSPDEVTTLTSAGVLPDEELFSTEWLEAGKLAVLGCYAGDPDEGMEAMAPLRQLGDPIGDFSAVMPYIELQQLFDPDYPEGMRYYWKSLYLDGLTDAAIDRITHWTERAPSPLSTVDIWELGGAITSVSPKDSAFTGRQAPYLLGVEANWEDPTQDEANIAWVRDCLDDMQQFSDGSIYLNFPGFNEDTEEATFGTAYERLVAVKNAYDPENLFSQNQNITPTA